AGLVTNDTLQPLRALAARRASATLRTAGRWSATRNLLLRQAPETERAHARAIMLLERHGVVSREAAAAEAIPGGFAAVSPVLRAMEEAGKVRRGYFVGGLAGAQFALPGAIDRLRAERPDAPGFDDESSGPDVVVMAALDPANPYGALLPWPDDATSRPRRAAGAQVVLVGGT